MTRNDLRILCTALGFSIVITGDVPQGKQALRATTIAGLIESFCQTSVPEAFADEHSEQMTSAAEAERLLERYIAELREHGSARFDFDRKTLLGMYELLLTQKLRHSQKEFYESSPDDVIANRILQMADEKIRREETRGQS
jgi:hypothetical protein